MTAVVILCLCQRGNSKVRIHATICDSLSEIESNLNLQGRYIDALIHARLSGGSTEEATAQANEADLTISNAVAKLLDTTQTVDMPLDFTAIKESWEALRELRAEVVAGREVAKNRDLANTAAIALSQLLLTTQHHLMAAQTRLLGRNALLLAIGFILESLFALAFLAIYHFQTAQRLRALAEDMALLNHRPPQPNAPRWPEPDEIADSLKQLDNRNRADTMAMQEFFASMSHDIRTPLNGIIGFLDSLGETNLNPQQTQYLSLIQSSARNLLHVINEVLDFSKITAGKLELEEVAFNLNALLEDRSALARQLLRSRPNVQFVYVPPTETAPIIIRSDPLRLRQVLDNLLGNAAKFTERGEVRLTLRVEDGNDGMVRLFFSVSDTGTGIAPDDLERLFQPYTQAERRTARKFGGTGLGLAICHSIVKLLGGQLEVNSRLGEGSTFSFSFQAPRAPEAEQLRIPGQFHVSLPTAELKKHFALLVDDTPTNLFLLETICQATGLPYRTAQNGLEAVQLAQRQSFDLIFMDIQMPVMDGYTAIREIRKLAGGAATHITALTASAYQEDVARALEAGANAFIPKPFERDQLLLCIADALGIQPQRKLLEEQDGGEAMEESTVRQMHEYMREQYRISLGEIKMVLAQTAADWRPLLDSLAIFANKNQADEVKAILHRLKGQLSSIGLPDFADYAATIMLDIQDGKPYQADVQQLIDSLSAIFRVLEKQVTLPHGQG